MTDPTRTERWLPVPGYEGFYEVSSFGQVKSIRHMTQAGWRGGKLLTPFPDADGYLRVSLSRYSKVRSYPVHMLVLRTFVREPLPGEQGRHGTDGKLCNNIRNLSWGTPLDNSNDKYRDGTMARGERQGNAKLTEDKVRAIRRRYTAGEAKATLAHYYDISQIHVSRIVLYQSWKHVP